MQVLICKVRLDLLILAIAGIMKGTDSSGRTRNHRTYGWLRCFAPGKNLLKIIVLLVETFAM
jgi:hypothetical protein